MKVLAFVPQPRLGQDRLMPLGRRKVVPTGTAGSVFPLYLL